MIKMAKALGKYMRTYETIRKKREEDGETIPDTFLEHRAIQKEMEVFDE